MITAFHRSSSCTNRKTRSNHDYSAVSRRNNMVPPSSTHSSRQRRFFVMANDEAHPLTPLASTHHKGPSLFLCCFVASMASRELPPPLTHAVVGKLSRGLRKRPGVL